jgi:hypothetical protein
VSKNRLPLIHLIDNPPYETAILRANFTAISTLVVLQRFTMGPTRQRQQVHLSGRMDV